MEAASPTKRRVLGSLDPNASPRPRLDAKQNGLPPSSPLKRVAVFSGTQEPDHKKRPLLFGEQAFNLLHPAKKVCQEGSRLDRRVDGHGPTLEMQETDRHDESAPPSQDQPRQQSGSPEPSSVFDSSAIDTSQATTITEPDVVGVTAAAAAAVSALAAIPDQPRRVLLTREEAREKAEILRLRLGLASYKLRTGQTDVPLEQLEQRSAARRVPSRNVAAGWASSRLQSQLRLQGTAANACSSTSGGGFGRPSSAATTSSTRRPLPGAPVRRTSRDDAASSANASFSSSQGSGRGQGAAAGQGVEGSAPRKGHGDERAGQQGRRLSDQTPQLHRRVEVGADDERLTMRGGAASGLLSLARS